jgi:predicted nucleic acid-binding protein
MTLIADASVALKWNIAEAGSAAALELFRRDPFIIAPDLVISELTNALWRKVLQGELQAPQASSALAATLRGFHKLEPCESLADRALSLAYALQHPAYDCFYLALAEASGAMFVTADARLVARLAKGGWTGKFEALKANV